MAKYDPKQSILRLNGYEITEFTEAADAISIVEAADLGSWTIGLTGGGVFVASGNESIILTIQLLQHSADNRYLSVLRNQQKTSLKSFTPFEMYFKDTLNGDDAVGFEGYFTTARTVARGNAHNAETWVIAFRKGRINHAAGAGN